MVSQVVSQLENLTLPGFVEIIAGLGSLALSIGLYILYRKQYQLDRVFQEPILKVDRIRAVRWNHETQEVIEDTDITSPEITDKFEIVLSNIGQGSAQDVQITLIPSAISGEGFNSWPHQTGQVTMDIDRRQILEDSHWLSIRETNIGSNEMEVSYLTEAGLQIYADRDPYEFEEVVNQCAEEGVSYLRLKVFVNFRDESGSPLNRKQVLDYVLFLNGVETLGEALKQGAPYREFDRDRDRFVFKALR